MRFSRLRRTIDNENARSALDCGGSTPPFLSFWGSMQAELS
jgi:hypothetical protein